MGKALKASLVAIACLLVAACAGSRDDGVIVIKFPHVVAPTTPKGRGAERLKQLVEQRLPGRVRMEVYPSGQLMNDDDSMEALAFGEVQMIAASLSKFDRLTKRFKVFDLPFMFPDIESVTRFQQSPEGRSLLGALADKGFLGLAFWHNGMKQFGAPRALRRPEDAAGLKFRIMESDVLQEQMRQIGGNAQKMDFGEVYQALQTGAIDAQENTWSNIYSQKFFEVQDYLMETNHGYIGYLLAVNPDFWNGLPAGIRAELEQIVDQVTREVNGESSAINAEARRKIIDSGASTLVELTPEELESWRAAMLPVWQQFEDQIGPDIVQAAQAAGSPETIASPDSSR